MSCWDVELYTHEEEPNASRTSRVTITSPTNTNISLVRNRLFVWLEKFKQLTFTGVYCYYDHNYSPLLPYIRLMYGINLFCFIRLCWGILQRRWAGLVWSDLCVVYSRSNQCSKAWGSKVAQWISARLPPMWPEFDSRTRRLMWVEFVVGSLPATRVHYSGDWATTHYADVK